MLKKLLVLLLLLPLSVFAKFYQGTITLTNGTVRQGYIKLPTEPTDSKIKFRAEEKGKNEKYKINEVREFEIINDDKETIRFTTIYLGSPRLFNHSEFKIEKKKSWVSIVKEGGIALYGAHYAPRAGSGMHPGTSSSPGGVVFYIQRPGETHALYLYTIENFSFTIAINSFKELRKIIKLYFDKICPNLESLITKADFKENGLSYIVNLYDENCGKE
ncbi:hypothetical protein [Flavobacterium kingsejongi]|uniref:DUF4468 domain-containing protein n=1 Tax=Flavobacterium kingsejongi TaxID=1678728 RepID=A0A2S1LSF2_9FLAO|nr:hypothetical protein [Flavobacterium kingsejongi]AWG26618.1 hypothetical protein FK004_15990 [Flavobacterium kingsejongi]